MSRAMSRVLLLLATTSLCAAGVEIAVRVFGIGPDISAVHSQNFRLSDNPVLRYELVPGSPDGASSISREGLRDREYVVPKPEGTFRIATIGDSISYGHDVAQREAFSAVLEELLEQHFSREGLRFEVLNFGVTGYGVTQIAESLRAKALAFDPDLVLYAYCLNDPQEFSLEMESLLAKATSAERGYLERAATEQLRTVSLIRYLLHSQTREGQRVGETPRWFRDDPQFIAIERGGYAPYHRRLYRDPAPRARLRLGFDSLAAVAHEHEIPVLLIVFPLLHDLESYALEAEHGQIIALAKERSLLTSDLLALFQSLPSEDLPSYVLDPVHPSELGHQLVAVAILYELLAGGWLPESRLADFDRLHHSQPPIQRLSRMVQNVASQR